jgi:hypothetical protein
MCESVSRSWGAVSRGHEAVMERNCEVLTDIEDFMCYSYSIIESVIIIGSHDLWISNKSIHQPKPRLQVTKTHDNT